MRWWMRGLVAFAVFGALGGTARADIRDTPHSLVKSDGTAVRPDERKVCVFCHTPDVNNRESRPQLPRWQHSIDKEYVFPIYDDIGRLGLGRESVGSQSIACLSCHDANQALTASRTSNDHPFGVPYRGAIKGRPMSSKPERPDGSNTPPHIHAKRLVALDDFHDVSHGTVENRTVWWVSKSGMTARRSRNDLPLYSRLDDETGEELPHIECSSCHDPHSPNQQFLRISNDGSALCLTCHNK